MTLHVYDSAKRALVPFESINAGKVGIYLCGATVQGSPHIGHIRSALAFDVLIRWLKRTGYEVTYVRNVTDIDDKILNKSQEAGWQWWAWALRFEREFSAAYRDLGLIEPTYEPRATGHVPEQIALIERLFQRGHAYTDGNGNVYFDVKSLADYGSLTHQKLDDMRSTEDPSQVLERVEEGKQDPRDFALWKAAKPSEPATASWDSPWGRGRPGWHLECSAMSRKYLGEAFDIHGGGIDLRFPHHENEQAQSHGAGWSFAKYWMHNAWVTIKGEKMSKSLGNSLVVGELLKQTPAPVLRYALGTVHYRSTVEYGPDTLEQAQINWEKFAGSVNRFASHSEQVALAGEDELAQVSLPEAFVKAMDDDLNVSAALAVIFETTKKANGAFAQLGAGMSADDAAVQLALQVRAMLDVLGLDPLSKQWAGSGVQGGVVADGGLNAMRDALDALVQSQLEARASAKAAKDWASADVIRDSLAAAGIQIKDTPQGVQWSL